MEKIKLPIEVDEPTPTKIDWKWFTKMILSIVTILITTFGGVYIFSMVVLKNMSFETEKELFQEDCDKLDLNKYIDYNINEFKKFNICLLDSDDVNAYTTLGGNIYITKGFLENIDNQEELVFAIAHEIGHILHRDVIKKLINQLSFSISFHILGYYLGIDNFDVSNIMDFGSIIYSKEVELSADKYAIDLLKKYDINLMCILPFFKKSEKFDTLALLSDHPLNKTRVLLIKKSMQGSKKNCQKLKKR